MTEDEWFTKKKQIKLLRERVRKTKVAAGKYEETKKTAMDAKRDLCLAPVAEPEVEIETDEDDDEEGDDDDESKHDQKVSESSSHRRFPSSIAAPFLTLEPVRRALSGIVTEKWSWRSCGWQRTD
jgi:recombination DNA repair RAD52 pathway protein